MLGRHGDTGARGLWSLSEVGQRHRVATTNGMTRWRQARRRGPRQGEDNSTWDGMHRQASCPGALCPSGGGGFHGGSGQPMGRGFGHVVGNRQPGHGRGRRGTKSHVEAGHVSGAGVVRQRLARRSVAPSRFARRARPAREHGHGIGEEERDGGWRVGHGAERVGGKWATMGCVGGPGSLRKN
jgi:hypothetical protein